jgi:hypothetical protein
MDEETRAEFAAIRELMNDQHERLIDQIKSLSHDFQNTTGRRRWHLIPSRRARRRPQTTA